MRQKIGGPVDGGLDFLFGDVNVEIKIELQGDDGAAEGTRGGHLTQAGDLAELALEGSRDGRNHHVGASAWIKCLNLNCGIVDLRKRGDGKLTIGHKAYQQHPNHQEGGCDRP